MQRGADAPAGRDTTAIVRLRDDRFRAMTSALGYTTDFARARFIGVDVKTLRRVRAGSIGQDFIIKTLAALRQHERTLLDEGYAVSFESLFLIIDEAVS